jgi:hypothetical protein
LRLTNLDPASTYQVSVFGYRDAAGNTRVGKYTIGSTSQTLNAAGNLSNKAVFTGVTPLADGSIELTVERDTGSTFAYLSVLELQKETASSSQAMMAVQEATLQVAQGSAGSFKRTLALNGDPSVESRRRADGSYTVGFTFNKVVTSASATLAGTATLDGAPVVSGSTVTVGLKNVANKQTLRVNLNNIITAGGRAAGSASVAVKILAGDVNTSANVNSTDVLLIKSEENRPVTSANAASDIDANGVIDATDVNAARAALGAEATP